MIITYLDPWGKDECCCVEIWSLGFRGLGV